MMRIACFALAALTCSVTLAEMPANNQGQQQTAGTEAKPEQNEAQQAQDGQAQGEAQVENPLHRHPTLLSMLRRNNEIRRRLSLIPHRINPALTKAAQDHANYMARTGDFQHYSNGGPQYRAQKFGFRGFVRENIAYNYRSVEDAFSVWQGSSGHYASIVSGTDEAGFGYAIGPGGAIYYVGVYGHATTADERGEDEGLAEKLAAEEAEKNGTEASPAKVEVDRQVVPAAAQEPAPQEPAAANEAAAATGTQPQTQQPAATTTYYNNNRGRGLFRRRR